MSPPVVSVCLDVFNYANYLPEAIESVLRQTLSDFELIVVDDCSTDESFDIARTYAAQDGRIQVFRNDANLGMVVNRRACLNRATGEFVKWLHADDFLCTPDALSIMAARLQECPSAALVACPTLPVGPDSLPRGNPASRFSSTKLLAGVSVIRRCLREQKNLVGGPSAVMFRRALSGRGFDESYFHAADLEMWFHLLEQGCFAYIEQPLAAYRWHALQQTEKDRQTLSQAHDWQALLDNYLTKSYIRIHKIEREYLAHEAVRQAIRRCRAISHPEVAADRLQTHGAARYHANQPWCFAWRKLHKVSTGALKLIFSRDTPEETTRAASLKPMGVNVAGFFRGQYGIGESSRAYCRAVSESGLPFTLVNIDSKDHINRDTSIGQISNRNPYGVNLMTFSFDYARRFFRDRGKRFFKNRHNIAIWYWELERFPVRWHSNFEYYDEIWVPTAFCHKSIAAVSPIPVRQMTYPFYPIETVRADRTSLALSDQVFVFLFSFDFFSTLERKNPLAVIEAFRRAFEPASDVVLVLKSINSEHDPKGAEQVRRAIDGLRGLRVIWIESHLTGTEMSSLFSQADCYVSLHRSEGLGLGMAQAMAMGKPVISTGYSGNLEFMNADNSLLVEYDLVELQESCGPASQPVIYEKGGVWAEPHIDHAAALMRRVYSHREESKALGERARASIAVQLDPVKTQAEISERMHQICGAANG